ncbi:MAG: hypothetical protein WDO24_12020 [Pseudomonadota bacterium]
MRVTDESGFLVAIMAERMYRCDDFMELLRNTRLWFDKGPVAVSPEFRPINGFDAFGGIVGHGSGLWVDPAFRRHGVSSFLPDYYRRSRSVIIRSTGTPASCSSRSTRTPARPINIPRSSW